MTNLIIYASPNNEGHNAFTLQQTKILLEQKKEKYEVLDLYKIKYDPVLIFSEKKDLLTKQLQKKISEAQNLIFIYPVWWNNVPAILKGFIDKTLVAGFAYQYKKRFFGTIPEGLLKGKKAVLLITTGSPKTFYCLSGKRAQKVVSKDTLKFCGIKSKTYHYGDAINLTEKSKKIIANNVKQALNWLK